MSGERKKPRLFDWIPYLFGTEETSHAGETDDASTDGDAKPKDRKKKKRKGIDDENPVSFRTTIGPITAQQAVYFVLRDLLYASGPMFTYIAITLLCILLGYPLSGMGRYTFAEYLGERSKLLVAIGVVITLRVLYKKSKKRGSAFFEDATLYHKNVNFKKIGMGLLFGAGAALFLSAILTLIPKVWVFASYDASVNRIYQRYDIALTIIESALLTPLVEEIIFRGYMLNRLLRRWADLPALIVTTAVFSVMHGTSVWIIYAFAMGWIIGQISIREGNILYGIFVHAGFNLPSVVMWFSRFVHPERQGVEAVTSVFQTVLTGVAGFAAAALMAALYLREKKPDTDGIG